MSSYRGLLRTLRGSYNRSFMEPVCRHYLGRYVLDVGLQIDFQR